MKFCGVVMIVRFSRQSTYDDRDDDDDGLWFVEDSSEAVWRVFIERVLFIIWILTGGDWLFLVLIVFLDSVL
jgi:hypothetical protein